jgi:hypothetical protein
MSVSLGKIAAGSRVIEREVLHMSDLIADRNSPAVAKNGEATARLPLAAAAVLVVLSSVLGWAVLIWAAASI